jgi:N-acetylglutamate synthase-like GNAT family acetyltransferase
MPIVRVCAGRRQALDRHRADEQEYPRAMSGVQIVPYEDRHLAGIRNLIVPIQQNEFGFSITYEDQKDLHDIPAFYRRDGGEFWVAVAGPEIVGSIALVDIGNAQGALRKMFVNAAYRGPQHGLARRLLERLLDHAGRHGIGEIFLGTTEKFRAAHRFYEKSGFERIDEADLPQRFPHMNVDTRFYRLRFGALSSAP